MTPAEQAAEQLRFVTRTLVRRMRADSPGPEFSRPLHSVLRRLDTDGPMTTADLARAEFITPQTMGAFVAELEEYKLVERTADPNDGRRRLVSLTREGSRVLTEGRARRQSWLAHAIETQLNADEQRTVLAALELLRKVATS